MICSVILAVLVIVYYILWSRKKASGEIPIEKGLPLVGVLFRLKYPVLHYYEKLARKHGPMFRMRIGMRDVFVLNDYPSIRKAFIENGNNFAGRWNLFQALVATNNAGLVSIDGDLWHTHRTFVLKVMHKCEISLDSIQDECICLLEELESLNKTVVNVSEFIRVFTVNIISKFVISKRFNRDNPTFKFLSKMSYEFAERADIFQFLFFTFPIFDKLPWFCRLLINLTERGRQFREAHRIFQEEIEEHRKTLDLDSEGVDLFDCFLIKQHQLKSTTGTVGSFTDVQLIQSSLELFIAGFETTSTILEWGFLFMAYYKCMQEKVYEEIIEKIGKERLPTMNDKKELIYTQAVMDEIYRLSSISPLAIVHRVTNDCRIDGYLIPRDSLVQSNIWSCHTDPNVWKKPKEFYPQHFLSKDSIGNIKYDPKQELNAFGFGKRQCIGESLARIEYFMFFTSVLQRFEVSFAKHVNEIEFKSSILGCDGIIRSPVLLKEYIFTRRE